MQDTIFPVAARVEIQNISYFPGDIKNTDRPVDVSIEDIYNKITGPEFAAVTSQYRSITEKSIADKFKPANFGYATFNGTFLYRNDKGLKQLSKYFIIDVDKLGASLPEVLERLKGDGVLCPQLIFISPSGDGLKIVVRIDPAIIDLSLTSKIMGNIWQAVNSYIGKHYGDLITANEKGEYIDGACKDVSRACFICHDPKAYLNINDNNVLGAEFVEAYPAIEQHKAKSKKTKIVSPRTTINDLAERHLLKTDNHHNNITAFAGAAKSIAIPFEDTLNFIYNHVHISPDSSHSDPEKIKKEVEDIYDRYSTDSPGVIRLTPLTFGYEILHFKYSKDAKQFVVSSLFLDEVRTILHRAGFAKRKIGKSFIYIRVTGCIISEVSPEQMRDYLTKYVESIEQSICFIYQGEVYQIPPAAVRETYLKNSNNIFNAVWLEHLRIHDAPILKDTENEMYFFFKNELVTVSRNGIRAEKWEDKAGFCIWEEQIINHDFELVEDTDQSHFLKFLHNVTNNNTARLITMYSGLGYLMHHYFKESEGQAVIFYDETITDTQKPMGGSGKGLIVNALKQIRKIAKVDGKHLDSGNRFRYEQVSPSTQIVWLDDIKPDFEFSQLYSNLTDGWTIERKYLSQFLIEPKDSPKTVICSNSIIKGGGTTNKRRQFIIELSDYYSRQIIKGDEKPIEQTHGCIFFSNTQWDAKEWNMFFTVMFTCAFQYLNQGLVFSPGVNVELNRFRQATDEDFAAWVEQQGFEAGKRYDTKTHYGLFVATYYGEHYQIGQRKFTGYLKEYAAYRGWGFEVVQVNGISYFKF